MTELYLVRHAIAVDRGMPGLPDDARPLTPKGRKRMQQIAKGLRRLGLRPDRILTSPLPRALETAEIVADALGLADRLECIDMLRPDRDTPVIRDWILTRTDDRLMLVGHNPGLSELQGLLVAGLANPLVCALKKGGVAALASRPGGGFEIDWIAQPRLLRLVADA
jgi:phosphohistidine phosphatase